MPCRAMLARLSQKELQHTINLHPSYFGPQTEVYLRNKLHADVEGTCSGRVGYIIAVLGVRRQLCDMLGSCRLTPCARAR